jgi:hypothetical protein
VRLFQESYHGKGQVDGLGAVVKQQLGKEALKTDGPYFDSLNDTYSCFRCAVETLAFDSGTQTDMQCRLKRSERARCKANSRQFYYIDRPTMEQARAKRPAFHAVQGSRSFHCVQSTGTPGEIESRLRHCVCIGCLGRYANSGAEYKLCHHSTVRWLASRDKLQA